MKNLRFFISAYAHFYIRRNICNMGTHVLCRQEARPSHPRLVRDCMNKSRCTRRIRRIRSSRSLPHAYIHILKNPFLHLKKRSVYILSQNIRNCNPCLKRTQNIKKQRKTSAKSDISGKAEVFCQSERYLRYSTQLKSIA